MPLQSKLPIAEDELSSFASSLFDKALSGIIVLDSVGRVAVVNAEFSSMTGFDPEDLAGKTPKFLFEGAASGDSYKDFIAELVSAGAYSGTTLARCRSGEAKPFKLRFFTISNRRGVASHYAGLVADARGCDGFCTQEDPITGLMDDVALARRLRFLIARSEKTLAPLAVLYFDIDGFKHIVAKYDYIRTDRILSGVADVLRDHFGDGENLARVGADKFVAVLEDVFSQDELENRAGALLSALASARAIHGDIDKVSFSMGVAICPISGDTAAELIANADAARVVAKESKGKKIAYHKRFDEAE